MASAHAPWKLSQWRCWLSGGWKWSRSGMVETLVYDSVVGTVRKLLNHFTPCREDHPRRSLPQPVEQEVRRAAVLRVFVAGVDQDHLHAGRLEPLGQLDAEDRGVGGVL